MVQLDSRKEFILQVLISEYLHVAEPIGSEFIAKKYQLGVRSATIRNELAEMEGMGYLEQPHVSAGRIPSDLGYRYYVDYLAHPHQPDTEARHKIKQIVQEGEFLQDILRATTNLLSRITNLMSIATAYKDGNVVVRNVILNFISSNRVLLVLILSNGQVENRIIEWPPELPLSEVNAINAHLEQTIQGKNLKTLSKIKATPSEKEDPKSSTYRFKTTLYSTIHSIAQELSRGNLVVEGEEYMFAQPESKKNARYLEDLIHSLSDQELLYVAFTHSEDPKEEVIIGRENYSIHLYPFTLIKKIFFVGNEEAGIIGLMGPTRLDYDSCIPILHYAANSVTAALTKSLLA
jgi:heat-inducible transcriptional repressor